MKSHKVMRDRGRITCSLGLASVLVVGLLAAPPGSRAADLPLLTNAQQVWRLAPTEAQRGYPVRLSGVITLHEPNAGLLFFQDATRGLFVLGGASGTNLLQGWEVELEGITAPGDLNPIVARPRLRLLRAQAPMPAPRLVKAADLREGSADCQWVEVQGVVRSLEERRNQLWLDLGWLRESISVAINDYPRTNLAAAQWIDALVQVRAVAVTRANRQRQVEQVELHTAHWTNVVRLAPPPEDPWGSAILPVNRWQELLEGTNLLHRTHARGRVLEEQPGQAWLVQEGPSRFLLEPQQGSALRPGDWIEILGFPGQAGGRPALKQALVRSIGLKRQTAIQWAGRIPETLSEADFLPLLTQVRAVRELAPGQAALGYPVRVQGVVTFCDVGQGLLFLQDYASGIYVQPSADTPSFRPGQVLEVQGFSDPGGFAPIIVPSAYKVLGEGELPPPRSVSMEALRGGEYDSWLVEVSGVVRAVRPEARPVTLEVSTGGEPLTVSILEPWKGPEALNLVDAQVRISGVVVSQSNNRRQLLNVSLWTSHPRQVQVLEPAPREPFASPVTHLRDLAVFRTQPASAHRVRARGVVTCFLAPKGFFLQDDTGSAWVQSREPLELEVGEAVEVMGFPRVVNYSPALQEAQVRRVGGGGPQAPEPISVAQASSGEKDGALVELQARLLALTVRERERRLTAEASNWVFEVRFQSPVAGKWWDSLDVGSRLRLTGICVVHGDPASKPTSFELLARSPRDVQVLERPSWWARAEVLRVVAGMAGVVLLAVAWAWALQRRVRRQTELIRARLEREAALEEHYRLVWENSVDGMRLTDEEGRILRVNEAFCRLVGKPKQALEGQLLSCAYAAEHHSRVLEQYRAQFQAQRINPHLCRQLTLWDGRRAWLEVSNSLFTVKGEAPRVLSVFRDVTARKQEEAQRSALERKVLEAQRFESLGVLAGGIAHDFNNMLTAILGNAGLAGMNLSPHSPLQSYLRNIEKTCRRAADLCRQMLAYAGRGRFEIQTLDLNEVLSAMRQLIQSSITTKCELQLELAPGLPAIAADPNQMRQLMMSLVINAAEAIGDQSGRIVVRTGSLSASRDDFAQTHSDPDLPEGTYVFVEVVDTGPGMTAEVKARIFDPFFSTKFTGRGLGLSAALGIVQGHKGAMGVESELGRGSVFRFLLPAVSVPAAAPAPPLPPKDDWRGTGTILIVEDEDALRTVAERMLKTLGFNTLSAADGLEGVAAFRAHQAQVTLVLLDMTMPRLNGRETYRQLRGLSASVPVVLMTGYNEEEATARFASDGLAGFLQKPFDLDELRQTLRSALANRAT